MMNDPKSTTQAPVGAAPPVVLASPTLLTRIETLIPKVEAAITTAVPKIEGDIPKVESAVTKYWMGGAGLIAGLVIEHLLKFL